MPRKINRNTPATVLGYLLRYGSITRATAWGQFDVVDLPKIISRIRKTTDHKITYSGTGKNLKYTIAPIAKKYKGLFPDERVTCLPDRQATNQQPTTIQAHE